MAKIPVTLFKVPASTHKTFRKSLASLPSKTVPKAAGIVIPDPLPDNGDIPFILVGVDQAGNQVALDPTQVTMTDSSDTPTVVTVDPPGTAGTPAGLASTIHAAVPAPSVGATANVTLTATWPAGSTTGPFSFDWPQTIVASPIAGVGVQPGTPTSH